MKTRLSLAAALVCCASIAPIVAGADPWEVRREAREGARNIDIERHEAAREVERCKTRQCVMHETREGQREVDRERHEARHEIHRERAEDYRPPVRYARNTPNYGDNRYYGGGQYNGGGQYYNGGQYYGASQYRGANDWDRIGHYHPGGQYCRDTRHVAHLRDAYYRGDRHWYRDGRSWNESAYVNRYYRSHRGGNGGNDGNDDLVRGIVIGAAVVGVIAAIHEAND